MKWFPDSFRSRLALAIGAMAVGVGLPFYVYLGHIYGQQLVQEREQSLHDLAESVAAVVSLNLGERLREISLLAPAEVSGGGAHGPGPDRAALDRLQTAYPTYAWIGVTDPAGKKKAVSVARPTRIQSGGGRPPPTAASSAAISRLRSRRCAITAT